MNNVKKFTIIILIFLMFLSCFKTYIFADEIDEETDFVWLQEEIANASASASSEPVLNSRYVVAFDRSSKTILFGKNENQKAPMASTTKIMTAIVLIENLGASNGLSLNSEVEVCKQAASIEGSRLGLKTGDRITINDLLYGLMLCSRKRCCNTNSRKYSGEHRRICKFNEQKGGRIGS